MVVAICDNRKELVYKVVAMEEAIATIPYEMHHTVISFTPTQWNLVVFSMSTKKDYIKQVHIYA